MIVRVFHTRRWDAALVVLLLVAALTIGAGAVFADCALVAVGLDTSLWTTSSRLLKNGL
jgi:hypothetical protein